MASWTRDDSFATLLWSLLSCRRRHQRHWQRQQLRCSHSCFNLFMSVSPFTSIRQPAQLARLPAADFWHWFPCAGRNFWRLQRNLIHRFDLSAAERSVRAKVRAAIRFRSHVLACVAAATGPYLGHRWMPAAREIRVVKSHHRIMPALVEPLRRDARNLARRLTRKRLRRASHQSGDLCGEALGSTAPCSQEALV